jgi:hypothetical protein
MLRADAATIADAGFRPSLALPRAVQAALEPACLLAGNARLELSHGSVPACGLAPPIWPGRATGRRA